MRAADVLRLLPNRPPAPYGVARLARAASIEDLAALARRRLPAAARAYLDGGGEDEYTLRRNRAAFDDIELVPRALRDVSTLDTATTILGGTTPLPIALAPVGAPRFLHHEAELAVTRAAAAAGVPYAISTVGSVPIERIAAEADTDLWLQLYVAGDRRDTDALVDRAASAGCRALVLTADVTVRSKRERELDAGLGLPQPHPRVSTVIDALGHPVWLWHFLAGRFPGFPNVNPSAADTAARVDLSDLFDGTACWDDLEHLRHRWNGPLALKGILSPADARRAVDAGIDAVIVSNHGGRQLDHLPATIDVLPGIVDAVGDDAEVLLDSGIRRGTDIVAALALGARAVLVGRAYLYGLAAAGEAGVRHAIDVLADELRTTLALVGAASLDELGPDLVRLVDVRPQPGGRRGGADVRH
ncbi:MAG: alpha-hydroxy acid oxidase [Acidimicrobiia bacterium]